MAKTWECANCDHATDDREAAEKHLMECEGAGEYPDELDPEPYVHFLDGRRYGQRYFDTAREIAGAFAGTIYFFRPRSGYVQDRNAYDA